MPNLSERESPKLTRPPLREALIDIRLRDELPASFLPKFEAPKGFPVKRGIKHDQFQFQADADKPFAAKVLTEEALGMRYEREDSSEVVQLRRNGLTYSILKNYPGMTGRPQYSLLARFIFQSGHYRTIAPAKPKPNAFLPDPSKLKSSAIWRDTLPEQEIWEIGDSLGAARSKQPLARADFDVAAVSEAIEPDPKPHPLHVQPLRMADWQG